MAKVLVIRKTDKTIHKVNLNNKATLMAYNQRSKLGWKFEEMEEEEANKLPFIDESYVTAAEAQTKVKQLEAATEEKDAQIAALQAQLAALNGGGGTIVSLTAIEVIEKIKAATNADEVNTLLGNDERKSVQEAASKKLASFEN